MSDVSSLRDTVAPKSDQLNADDLIGGPLDVTVTGVARGNAEQPVEIRLEGQRPFRPCKSMRRVLIAAWGDDGRQWVGRSMRLYRDEAVMYGGVQVGGIRISHLSHLDRALSMALTAKRGQRKPYIVQPLPAAPSAALAGVLERIAAAQDMPSLEAIKGDAGKLPAADKPAAIAAYNGRRRDLTPAAAAGE